MDFFLREKVGGFSGKGVSEGKRGTRGGAASMDAKIHHGCENPYIFFTSTMDLHIHGMDVKKKIHHGFFHAEGKTGSF